MDPLVIGLIVLGLSSILTIGILCTFVPLKVDRFYANNSGERYALGMNERSRVLLWRITGLMSLVGVAVLCSFVAWAAFLRPYYYGF